MAFLCSILLQQIIVLQARKIQKISTHLVTEGRVDYEDDYALKILRHLRKNPQRLLFLYL